LNLEIEIAFIKPLDGGAMNAMAIGTQAGCDLGIIDLT
jgi:hypothetical protein